MLTAEMCDQSTLCSVAREGVVDSDPEVISAFVRSNALVRIGLEIGPPATWLSTQLKRLGLPVICIDARRAKAVLKCRSIKATATMRLVSAASSRPAGLLKNLDLAIGRPKFNVFAARAEELIEDRPELIAAVGPPTLIC